ncbi:TonB-dependent siderophore receptor [Serratia rubidaea]|uniref:TonB-dependent siderophore receptor n=1 Tax=Serratia rubidaea TaxID=61652 RepID=A0A3S4GN72_SERRU|nr:TonB-dependent siderophore receptor [Serratia rubidaea]
MTPTAPQAPSYTTVGLNSGYRYPLGNWLVNVFGRVDNLFDRDYVGSVIVNEATGVSMSRRRDVIGAAASA